MIGLAEYMQARHKAHTRVELCLMLGCSMLALRRFERRYSLRWMPVPRLAWWSRLLRAIRI